jgi:hypothetical protein
MKMNLKTPERLAQATAVAAMLALILTFIPA